jgi:tRNA A-37 threonylcarbamoyl transferase component Bud32
MTSESEAIKGRRIDRYDLHELIGEGGMGAVYRAVDSRLGRTVALKTVVPQRSGAGLTDELRQRFMREALAASKVEHRNVVQVLDFGVTGDGTPYLVMEYLRGQDLGVLLRRSREPLAIEYVADVMLGVCAALRACHQLGIVHRDLKPSNIFLADTDTGHEIKVLDFGVSKAPMAADLTQEGQILGTPQYLSPEQVNGKVGPESDQYALGVLLYVCLTKRLPFEEHQNLSLLRAIEVGRFRGPRAHRADIPAALEAIILRAMHADPAERFESVHVLGQRLWEFASSRGQVEWKNYYFHSPPVAMPAKGTLRGVPLAPAVPESDEAPGDGVPLGATELLAKSESGPPAVVSPQLFISTKLARPAAAPAQVAAKELDGEASQEDADDDGSRAGVWRRRATIAVIAGLVAVGAGIGLGHGRFRNPAATPAPIADPPSAQPIPPPALIAAPSPPPSVRPPTAVSKPSPAPAPSPTPTPPPPSQKPGAPAARQKKPSSVPKKHAPLSGKSPKMGLDQNGIGIPSN